MVRRRAAELAARHARVGLLDALGRRRRGASWRWPRGRVASARRSPTNAGHADRAGRGPGRPSPGPRGGSGRPRSDRRRARRRRHRRRDDRPSAVRRRAVLALAPFVEASTAGCRGGGRAAARARPTTTGRFAKPPKTSPLHNRVPSPSAWHAGQATYSQGTRLDGMRTDCSGRRWCPGLGSRGGGRGSWRRLLRGGS